MTHLQVNRRDALKSLGLGSGFAVAAQIPFSGRLMGAETTFKPNAWIHFSPGGEITFYLDKAEMGQSVYTGLTTIVAEELDVDPKTISVKFAPAHRDYVNADFNVQQTGGSTSTKSSYMILRKAAASAKATLIAAAAKDWGVPAGECSSRDGTVTHAKTGKSGSFKDFIATAQTLELQVGQLKDEKDFRFIGKVVDRLDGLEKIMGQAKFGLDFHHPDMVNAVVIRPPSFSGKAIEFDAEAAKKMDGVIDVFAIDTGIAVVARKFWQAKKAAASVNPKWDGGDIGKLSSSEISLMMRGEIDSGDEVKNVGHVDKVFKEHQADVLAVEYECPYLAHAPMEPVNCTAYVTKNSCDIWGPTQGAGPAQQFAAEESGLDHDQVRIHSMHLGGSFGRKLQQWDIKEAIQISKRVGKPTKVTWTREDDMKHGFFRPANYHRLRAVLDASTGYPLAWEHRIACPSIMGEMIPQFTRIGMPQGMPEWIKRFSGWAAGGMFNTFATDNTSIEGAEDQPYQVDNFRVTCATVDPGIPVGFWRSVGHSQNGFVVESFIDELAHRAGKDPYQYRRALLKNHDRERNVLDRVAKLANWGSKLPEGRFHGIAQHTSFGSAVAQVVEASVEDNKTKVHKVYCVIECGTVINPDAVRAQMESGIIFGLTAALYGKNTIENGGVKESNFHDYPLLRMNESPEIILEIVPDQGKPQGVGEPGTPPVTPALTNAIFAATGKRVRSLPINLGNAAS